MIQDETPTELGNDDNSFYFYKMPTLNHSQDLTLIGMIDASGSMEEGLNRQYQIWPYLTKQWNKFIEPYKLVYSITFSQTPKIRGRELHQDLKKHGGFQTNISKAFEGLIQLLESDKPKTQQITIIFISDGEDSDQLTIYERINKLDLKRFSLSHSIQFICIGVGYDFPTFLAIQLRSQLHNGDQNVPFIFKIHTEVIHTVEKQFQNTFNRLEDYTFHNSKIITLQPIFLYPWIKEMVQVAYSSQWVLCNYGELSINYQGFTYNLAGIAKLSIQQSIEIGLEWLQALQLESYVSNVSKQARYAYKIFDQLVQLQVGKLTVLERRKLMNKRSLEGQIYQILEQFNRLAMNQFLSSLSAEEAAKRLQIRTKIGKYHDKVLKYSGLTIDQYQSAKDSFVKILQTTEINGISTQESSIFSMQNTMDILIENDLIQGLQDCQNQYELIDCFPIIGYALQVYRTNSSLINPYLINVISMARHHKIVDSISLLQRGNEMHLQTGNGDVEIINCVLPLFDEIELKPFINSTLYHILMTFNVMQNVDTLQQEAYSALLANCLLYLINLNDSMWKQQLLHLIRSTFKLVYDEHEEFKVISQNIKNNNIQQVLLQENKELSTFCQDPCKIILVAFAQSIMNQQIAEFIIIEIISRLYPGESNIFDYFDFELEQKINDFDLSKELEESIDKTKLLSQFYSFKELNIKLSQLFNDATKQSSKLQQGKIRLNYDKLTFFQGKSRYSFQLVCAIYKFISKMELKENQFIQLLFHCNQYKKASIRVKQPIERNIAVIEQEIQILKYSPSRKFDRIKIIKELKDILYKEMIATHQLIIPLNIGQNEIPFHKNTQLVHNACMSPQCPYYMKVRNDYIDHTMTYKTFFLSYDFFRLIKKNSKYNSQQIREIIYQNKLIKAQDKYIMRKKAQYIIDTIENAKKIFL